MAHDLLIVGLKSTYFQHILRNAETSYSVTKVTMLQNYKLNLVFICQKPLSSDENLPDHS